MVIVKTLTIIETAIMIKTMAAVVKALRILRKKGIIAMYKKTLIVPAGTFMNCNAANFNRKKT